MVGFRSCLLALVSALGLTSVTPASSQASPILDQSQTIVGDSSSGCLGGSPAFTICGQSFTVGLTGTLTSVDFYLNNAGGTPEAGLYTNVSGSGAILAQTSPTVLSFGAEGFYSFAFNYAVSAGDVLFFGFHLDLGDNFFGPTVEPNTYLPGTLFYFDSSPKFIDGADSAFRTFVDTAAPVPEPASLTLLSLGLAGMAGRRWRQRKTTYFDGRRGSGAVQG